MATIEEEMKAWEEKEKQKEMLKKELSARMNAYKDIAIIRGLGPSGTKTISPTSTKSKTTSFSL